MEKVSIFSTWMVISTAWRRGLIVVRARNDGPLVDNPGFPFPSRPNAQTFQVTVIGWTNDQHSVPMELQLLPLTEVRRLGPTDAAHRALQGIPVAAPILLHFDIDVLSKQEMPASYFPHAEGLSIAEVQELLGIILADARVRIVEVTEYASLRDLDQSSVLGSASFS